MKIDAAKSFFESLNRMAFQDSWYYKIYGFFRYDIIRFFKNIVRFRKELWTFQSWDHSFNLSIFKRSLELTANYLEKHGHEIELSRDKKIDKIRRAIVLLNNHIEDNFIEQAENELGIKTCSSFEFKPHEDDTGSYELINSCSPEQNKLNRKIFSRASELEAEQWKELWEIIKGQEACPPNTNWDEFFNGSDIRGWWD